MHASKISDHEASFFSTGRDSGGTQFNLSDKSIRIPNSEEVMNYMNCRRADGVTSFFYDEKFPKTQIVIHFTQGYLKGDLQALTKADNHVSTAFLIPRNGKILNLFSSALWSYHLGKGAVGGNGNGGKRSVAIELSNIGYLREINGKLYGPYSDTDVYCDLSENQYYTQLDTPFRGYQYYASFTNEQYESLIVLLRYLTSQYGIPREFLPEDKRYITGTAADVPNFKGIVSHVNYRESKKWDYGPAFDWNRLIAGVQR
jgi:N-acetyl-anhydromuramyl-L-alanine amidase AmpD